MKQLFCIVLALWTIGFVGFVLDTSLRCFALSVRRVYAESLSKGMRVHIGVIWMLAIIVYFIGWPLIIWQSRFHKVARNFGRSNAR